MTRPYRQVLLCAMTALACPVAAESVAQVRDGATAVVQTGSATIRGTVVTADEVPRPVRRTLLTLSGTGLSPSLLALSDDEGRFEFRGLPEGRFTLAARKTGYVRDAYGARPVGSGAGVPIVVKAGGAVTLTMRMLRSAAFGGRVVLPPGAPVSNVRLQVLKWGRVNGRRQLISAVGGAYTLDANGEYRISGLPPGEYVLAAYTFGRPVVRTQAVDGPGALVGLAAVYSPGVTDPSRAEPVRLSAGDERRGVDLVMDFVEMGRVSGRVVGPDGQPIPFVQISTSQSAPVNSFVPPVRTQADGSFILPAVVPGSFTVVARGALPGTEQTRAAFSQGPPVPLWAYEPVSLSPGASMEGLLLQLRPGRSIRGTLVFGAGGTGPAPNLSGFILTLLPDDPETNIVGITAVAPNAAGSFEFAGVAPGRYRIQVTLPEPIRRIWAVTSMTAGEVDVLDAAVSVGTDADVTIRIGMSDQPSVLTGSVADAEGQPLAEHSVVVFSTDRRHWTLPSRRVVQAQTSVDGSYEVRGLPDGEYLVVAVGDLDSQDRLTPEFLEVVAVGASRVTVKDRSRVIHDLKTRR